jgi:hypothetical protein
MSEIVLVPGPSSDFTSTSTKLKLKPMERPLAGRRTVKGSPQSGTGKRPPPQSTPRPVVVKPDTGWPPPKVVTSFVVNRAALREAKSYNSWGELLSAVQSNFSEHSAADGVLYARVSTADDFDWDRAKKALTELGEKRLVVEYSGAGRGPSKRQTHGRV